MVANTTPRPHTGDGIGGAHSPARGNAWSAATMDVRPSQNRCITMNKAFVREPEDYGNAYCPRCGSLGTRVGEGALDTHCSPEVRGRVRESAWFCPVASCEVAYFNPFGMIIRANELRGPVYPKDPDATLCACFGFSMDDIYADLESEKPYRIRALLARSQSAEAHCSTAAADGQCCLREIQRLYIRLREARTESES